MTIKLLISIPPPPKLNITQKEGLFLALALGRAVGKTVNGMDTSPSDRPWWRFASKSQYMLHITL